VEGGARIADETMDQLKESAKRLGQSVNPEIAAKYTNMKLAIDRARAQADAGDFSAADESLGIADAYAKRVMKEGGR
jgi:hypothetical protein